MREGQKKNVLLTPILLVLYKKAIQFSSTFYLIPARWDSEAQRPERVTSKWIYRIWYTKNVLQMAYLLFAVGRFFYLAMEGKLEGVHKIMIIVIFAFYLCCLSLEAEHQKHHEQWAGFVRKTMNYYEYIEETCYKGATKKPRTIVIGELLELGVIGAAVINGFVFIVLGLVYYYSPGAIYVIFNYALGIPAGEYLSKRSLAVRAVAAPLQVYTHICIMLSGTRFTYTHLGACFILSVTMKYLKCQGGGVSKSVWATRIHLYHTLSLLLTQLVELHGFALMFIQYSVMLLVIFSVTSGIKVSNALGLFGGFPAINIFIVLMMLYNGVADFHHDSTEILQRWKYYRREMGPENAKKLVALRFLRFTVGGTYFIDKMALLTICKIIFDGSINVLVISAV